jgi:hypothetical protein
MADRPVAPHAPQQSHALGSINRTPRTLGKGGEETGRKKRKKTEERGGERKKPKERERGEEEE